MLNETRPLLLVICSDEARLAALRAELRSAGFLSAAGRSIEAALSLLSQVRVDGCVVAEPLDPLAAARLHDCLECYSAGCPKLCLPTSQPEPPHGWHGCPTEALLTRLHECFHLQPSHGSQ